MPDLEYARRNLNINRKEAEISNNVHVLRYDKGVVLRVRMFLFLEDAY